jgi:hypothetical protein
VVAAHPEIEPAVRPGGQRVDAVAAGRQPVHDETPAQEAPPVEARVRHNPPGVPRGDRPVRHHVADVQLTAMPQQSEGAEEPAHHLLRPGAAPAHEPDAVRRIAHVAGRRRPQAPARVERQVRGVRHAAGEGLRPHAVDRPDLGAGRSGERR